METLGLSIRTCNYLTIFVEKLHRQQSSRNSSLIIRRKLFRVQIFLLFRGFKSKFEFTNDLIIDSVSYKAYFLFLKLLNLIFDSPQQTHTAGIYLACDLILRLFAHFNTVCIQGYYSPKMAE